MSIARHRSLSSRSDEAFTLVELMIAMILLVVLGTLVMITMTNVLGIANQTSATYTGVNQVLGLSSTLEGLVRSEVEPIQPTAPGAPPAVQYPTPSPGFAAGYVGANSMTFYANTHIGTGVTQGPSQVVAGPLTNPNPCKGKCLINTTHTFTVTETAPDPGTCQTTANPAATGCTYSTMPPKQIISINNVANTSSQPIFTYTILNNGTPTAVTSAQLPLSGCAPSVNLALTCPADTIQSVNFDFFIYAPGAPSIAEYRTTAYRMSSDSYEYSKSVG
jgi:type II secretory pathway pseudopilin PulG